MSGKNVILATALALICFRPLGWAQAGEPGVVTGTVAYLQRSALPPDAIVHVQLQDVSAQDKPARIVAEAKIPTEGKQVPIAFRIPYAATDIDPAHRYVVRATISVGGKMIFTSTTAYPVITGGASTEVAIMVQPVSAHPAAGSRHRPAKLEGREWSLVELGGKPANASLDGKTPNLLLNANDRRLSGSGGCNRLVGGYELRGQSLHFTPAGLTRMACPEHLMTQEQAFVTALQSTTSYRIVGDTLELSDSSQVLARFKSSAASAAVPPATSNAPDFPTDLWLGQWNGPEGTYLLLAKNGDKYVVKIRSLDGLDTYEGVAAGERIQFTRDGKAESIRAGSGEETGMKWLLDKKNCLIIKTGEGFCRD
jgi:putative lipoprotein